MTENPIQIDETRNRAVLVGLAAASLPREDNASDATLEELAALVETAGGECLGTILQNRDAPEARTFIGEGKVQEVRRSWSRPWRRTWWSSTTSFPPPSSGSSPRTSASRSSTGRA